ncbi:MAG: DUF2264 domain-containing protein [Planctomycetota bacterium]
MAQLKRRPIPLDSESSDWLSWLERVAGPVLASAARGSLSADLPPIPGHEDRAPYAGTEAFCRTFCGMAPWLEHCPNHAGSFDPRATRSQLIEALVRAIDPKGEDRFVFYKPGQSLVEAAFLSQALLRAPSVWHELDGVNRDRLIDALVQTRQTLPPRCNWLLFSAMVEAFFASVDRPFDTMRIDYAVQQHEQWYLGDGVYSDGPSHAMDYYNSYVIHPLLLDVMGVVHDVAPTSHTAKLFEPVLRRFKRYADLQARSISPTGEFAPCGRSLCYRCGAFHLLAQASLQDRLPECLSPASARGALGAVIERTLGAANTFTDDGWLNPGLAGHQPGLAERYISRGSLYLCTTAFLPLGLASNDAFWSDPSADWTFKSIWSGVDAPADKALGAGG